jgi:hypothetical protein
MEHHSSTTISPGTPAARQAFFIYFGISAAAALTFLAITTFAGDYPAVARYGGAVWIFILTTIVTMPLVIPRVNERQKRI